MKMPKFDKNIDKEVHLVYKKTCLNCSNGFYTDEMDKIWCDNCVEMTPKLKKWHEDGHGL